MEFSIVAGFFDAIEQKTGRLEMIAHLAELFNQTPADEVQALLYLCQGKLAPDYVGLEAGLGEKLVIAAIAKASGQKETALVEAFKEQGDMGQIAQAAMEHRTQQFLSTHKLSVAKVHANLLKMAQSAGAGSQESKLRLLTELLGSATPLEARYIVRLPLGQLRLGVGDPSLLDALADPFVPEFAAKHPELVRTLETEYKKPDDVHRQLRMRLRAQFEGKYNVHPDLGHLAAVLKHKGLAGLSEIQIEVGVPIRPTLAERLPTIGEIVKKLGRCAIEAKYDGFRFGVHKNGERVTIFSRRMENMTPAFPEIVAAVRSHVRAEQAIFEGEALAVDPATGNFLSMQETIRRRRKYDVRQMAAEFPLKLFAFDLLFVDGESQMDKPFVERRERLSKLIAPGSLIDLTQTLESDDAAEIQAFFESCLSRGLEGIIAKDLHAPYIAGARKFAWIKFKKSYQSELSDSVDVCVVGFFKGKGSRTSFGLGALLGAVQNSETQSLQTVAKIGSGMTEAELTGLFDQLNPHRIATPPKNLESKITPDAWVEPRMVIEVRADEITKSPVHTCARDADGTGLGLRFPRFIQVRADKGPNDATTSQEIQRMFVQQAQTRKGKSDSSKPPTRPAAQTRTNRPPNK